MSDIVSKIEAGAETVVSDVKAAEPAVNEFVAIAGQLKGLVTNAGASAELTTALSFIQSAEAWFVAHFK